MDIIYHLQGSEFVWDKDKAQSNIRKHGVTFEEAAEVFFDPFYQTGDASVDDNEHVTLSLGIRSITISCWSFIQTVVQRHELFQRVLPRVQREKPMKKVNEDAVTTEEGFALRFRPRPSATVTLPMPNETLAALEKVAAGRDMSVEALIKFYVGQGLRQDLAQMFAEQVLAKTEQVLARHLQSEEAVSAILKEIRVAAVA